MSTLEEVIKSLTTLSVAQRILREQAASFVIGLMLAHFDAKEVEKFSIWLDTHDEDLEATPYDVIVSGEYDRFKKLKSLEQILEAFNGLNKKEELTANVLEEDVH